jgi:hypothetical protein
MDLIVFLGIFVGLPIFYLVRLDACGRLRGDGITDARRGRYMLVAGGTSGQADPAGSLPDLSPARDPARRSD